MVRTPLQDLSLMLNLTQSPTAIHVFRPYTTHIHTEFLDIYGTVGVPNAWGFLLFCACWTFVAVLFQIVVASRFPNHILMGYTRIAVEAVALLSWFAGFIATAVKIGTDVCPVDSCGALKAATVFGGLEWSLFLVTTAVTLRVVFDGTRVATTCKQSLDMVVSSKA